MSYYKILGLNDEPFSTSPDPSFFFLSKQHKAALTRLRIALNLKRKEEAERLAERVGGLSVVIIRQAGESGSLYGSVSARDISDACDAGGLTIARSQVIQEHPIKTLGLSKVRISLHPEVSMTVTVNVARSAEEAERQSRGEAVGAAAEDEEAALDAALAFENGEQPDIG